MEVKNPILEVCADNIRSVEIAARAGAERIELCSALSVGGLTLSAGLIKSAREVAGIQLFVLIRPRAGNFIYSGSEIRIMLEDIRTCGRMGCDGIVAGALTPDGDIDKLAAESFILTAADYEMGTTFHRAFDDCVDKVKGLETVIECGFDRILTSGGESLAVIGKNNISESVRRAAGRIIIMPGSGVNSTNIAMLASDTGAMEFHGSFSIPKAGQTRQSAVIGGNDYEIADAGEISRAIEELRNLNK